MLGCKYEFELYWGHGVLGFQLFWLERVAQTCFSGLRLFNDPFGDHKKQITKKAAEERQERVALRYKPAAAKSRRPEKQVCATELGDEFVNFSLSHAGSTHAGLLRGGSRRCRSFLNSSEAGPRPFPQNPHICHVIGICLIGHFALWLQDDVSPAVIR